MNVKLLGKLLKINRVIVVIPFMSFGVIFAQAELDQGPLAVSINPDNGTYSLATKAGLQVLRDVTISAKVNGKWIHGMDYSKPTISREVSIGELGQCRTWEVTYPGTQMMPTLMYKIRTYTKLPGGDVQVFIRNSTAKKIVIQDIRSVDARGSTALNLGAEETDDRILSDSVSENRPVIRVHDLADTSDQLSSMHRGVGSQLIYNRKSGNSLFFGALTSDKFLTILKLHLGGTAAAPHIASYEVDSAGTTELTKEDSLQRAPIEDQIELSLPVLPGKDLASERLYFSISSDYHRQLRTYGSLIRRIHHARVSNSTPMGWWSWTAYGPNLSAHSALKNAQWEAQNLKSIGYDFFHIDEGYSVARGDYLAPNLSLFPDGLGRVEKRVGAMGLIPGVWTAPFEVSDRSSVYKNHPDWLVHDLEGKPIRLVGWVISKDDRLYVLDATNPGAQSYLRRVYSTLTEKWGIKYIKLDFMEDTCIEGRYYRPNITALEAQRIGLTVIRSAVGDKVILDKDGGEMLNSVGIVDTGRTSNDTGHDFDRSKSAATGIAARYFMNRNYFITDPDAFTVTRGKGDTGLTLNEARVSIALAAVSGGMFEIGDDLPTLGSEPERFALVENKDLIVMARSGRASTPLDLMDYLPEDEQPSIFFLKESSMQSILTIFNWTDHSRTHSIALSRLGLKVTGPYEIFNVLDNRRIDVQDSSSLVVSQAAHSVQVLKLINMAGSNAF